MTGLRSMAGLVLALAFLPLPMSAAAGQPAKVEAVELKPCRMPDVAEELRCGIYHVRENRASGRGRTLPLKIVVLPARTPSLARDPIFWASGGPGETATDLASYFADNWRRRTHDLVLIDQRGTGEGHRLFCPVPGSGDDLQPFLETFMPVASVRACRAALEKDYDLTQYTTPIAVEDYDEVRRALGYDRIHLHAASYGSRFALAYLKKYDRHVRSALLYSLAPFENRIPLFMAAGRQEAFDTLVADCMRDERCRSAYPDPHGDLALVIKRLREQPARVTIPHPVSGAPVEVTLEEEGFVEAISGLMYWSPWNHAVPLMLRLAASGDYVRLVKNVFVRERPLREGFSLGMMLSVMCSEDTARIRPEDVAKETGGSFAGAYRAKHQMAACAEWPKATMPAGYFTPFRTKVPTILVSGRFDPPTGPRWGEVAQKYFANSVHLIVPAAHTPDSDCVGEVAGELLRTGSLAKLDTSCIAKMQPPPFRMPDE